MTLARQLVPHFHEIASGARMWSVHLLTFKLSNHFLQHHHHSYFLLHANTAVHTRLVTTTTTNS